MYQSEVVLCGASAYTKKFYLNEDFFNLPEQVKEELKIMCVLYTADVGGNLQSRTDYEEDDFTFDEIGSVLKIKQARQEKQDLLEALEMYFKVFFLGEEYMEE